MCLTFHIMASRKCLTRNFENFLRGTPIFAPQSSVFPKMRTSALPMTPLFYYRILFYLKNGDVCRKLELNPLRFDWDMRTLIKKNIFIIFNFFPLGTKNTVNQQVFKIFSKKLSTWWHLIPDKYQDPKPRCTKG